MQGTPENPNADHPESLVTASPVRVGTWTRAAFVERIDSVAVEEPLEIRLGQAESGRRQRQTVAITMRTPGQDEDLAVGFLVSEAILREPSDLQHVTIGRGVAIVDLHPGVTVDLARLQRHFYTTSSCGVCGKSSLEAVEAECEGPRQEGARLAARIVPQLVERLRQAQPTFARTGGLHAAGLFDTTGALLGLREDVGRHNAVDKLLGAEFRAQRWPLHDRVLVLSGRASFELIQKAAIARIPIVAAVGAPSSLAVQLARQFRMTLLGFVRDDRFNVYSARERLFFDSEH
jgi:FdhD protein